MSKEEVFVYGTATSCYQIEGAVDIGNRDASIWDTFCATDGKVMNHDTGKIACDHYHRYEEDVALLEEIGVDAYRLSLAWPRIMSEDGQIKQEGIEFYLNLLSSIKRRHIKTCVTLYHWDLPQWVEDKGGWQNREVVNYFLTYAKVCFKAFDHLVDSWITLNEPWCSAMLGYLTGEHAPGIKSPLAALKASHHLLVSHGVVLNYYKNEFLGKKPIGITLNLSPIVPNSMCDHDVLAATLHDGFTNRWFLDPIFKGEYPKDMLEIYNSIIGEFNFIEDEDLTLISSASDFLGINYYSRQLVTYDTDAPLKFKSAQSDYPKTSMGWDVSPEEFKWLIHRIRLDYTELPIVITENGAAYDDVLEADKTVHDEQRIDYIKLHLNAIQELNEQGMNITGYYLWSFLDNFEWAYGYQKRFGIVYVDYQTQKRYLKDSAKYYQALLRNR